MKLTTRQLRRYLSRLHFETPSHAAEPHDQVLEQVARRGCIQYDPLNVAGRNADLVLQSRIPGYKPEHLHTALYDKRLLLDGFDKNLAIYPVSDYPFFGRARKSGAWYINDAVRHSFEYVLHEISHRGPLCSDDLPLNEKVDWPWGKTKRARAALESLWMRGDLVLHHRKGARRFYDLAGRHIDSAILSAPDPNPTDEAYCAWQFLRRVGSVGVLGGGASDALLGTSMKAAARQKAVDQLLRDGLLTQVSAEGLIRPLYLRAQDVRTLEDALKSEPDGKMRVIAPLDNLIWDRKLIEALYGFEYRWEVYVPSGARKYGYYVLPVHFRDDFVARFEPVNFRGGLLRIAKWWWDKAPDRDAKKAREECLQAFCTYLGADGYEILEEY
jgi:uncharacterized protein YcaQ